MINQTSLCIQTQKDQFYDLTQKVDSIINQNKIISGLCHLFLLHTSASLLLCENADPSVKRDLKLFFNKLAPESTSMYEHSAEGKDDMPAHIKSIVTGVSLMLPIAYGKLKLGTWQSAYLWEHRKGSHEREVVVTILG